MAPGGPWASLKAVSIEQMASEKSLEHPAVPGRWRSDPHALPAGRSRLGETTGSTALCQSQTGQPDSVPACPHPRPLEEPPSLTLQTPPTCRQALPSPL